MGIQAKYICIDKPSLICFGIVINGSWWVVLSMSLMFKETFFLARTIRDDRPTMWTGLALILLVCVVVAAYVAARLLADASATALAIGNAIALGRDGSLSEILGYGFSFLAAVLFFLVGIERRSRTGIFLFILMAFVWLDDAAGYHERVGEWLTEALSLPAVGGLRAQDLGELLAWAFAGGAMLGVLVFALIRPRPGDLGMLGLFFLCFALLIACGVALDMLHVLAPVELGSEIGVIEDGGELIALALIAVIAIGNMRLGGEIAMTSS
jgi:hypothetical protein